MSHSYVSSLFHVVFSTKERQKLIDVEIKERLWAYICGIAKENKMKVLAIGGTIDHIHILLSLPGNMNISKAIQLIKGGSSKWVHERFPQYKNFSWQEGFGAFTISISHIDSTVRYINNQEEHHKVKTFEQEFIIFLKNIILIMMSVTFWGKAFSSVIPMGLY